MPPPINGCLSGTVISAWKVASRSPSSSAPWSVVPASMAAMPARASRRVNLVPITTSSFLQLQGEFILAGFDHGCQPRGFRLAVLFREGVIGHQVIGVELFLGVKHSH